MRLYGGRVLRNRINRAIEARVESRDAILYDVIPAQRLARVKIQGSNTLIVCHYPENWEQTPVWLKAGNAVRISHTGGNRGRLELTGHGILIPTPVAGGSGAPDIPEPADTVLTGCAVHASQPTAMTAIIEPGTYRIDNTVYTLSGLIMNRTDIEMNRFDLIMGEVAQTVSFAAAHATLFRYDRIVAGIDGLVEVVQGDNFAYTAPGSIPDLPADHVSLGWVLIYPNMTAIDQTDINRMFTTPVASQMRIAIEDDELEWTDLTTTLTVSIRDQYGNLITRAGEGYSLVLSWIGFGNGTLTVYGVDYDETGGDVSFYMPDDIVITYTRDQETTDLSPRFFIYENYTTLAQVATITLLNESGQPMYS